MPATALATPRALIHCDPQSCLTRRHCSVSRGQHEGADAQRGPVTVVGGWCAQCGALGVRVLPARLSGGSVYSLPPSQQRTQSVCISLSGPVSAPELVVQQGWVGPRERAFLTSPQGPPAGPTPLPSTTAPAWAPSSPIPSSLTRSPGQSPLVSPSGGGGPSASGICMSPWVLPEGRPTQSSRGSSAPQALVWEGGGVGRPDLLRFKGARGPQAAVSTGSSFSPGPSRERPWLPFSSQATAQCSELRGKCLRLWAKVSASWLILWLPGDPLLGQQERAPPWQARHAVSP